MHNIKGNQINVNALCLFIVHFFWAKQHSVAEHKLHGFHVSKTIPQFGVNQAV